MNLLDSLVELRKEIDEIDFEYILNRSQNEEWEVAAKISQAVVVRTYGGDAWSKLIRKEIFTSKFGATPFFLAGLVLGSFRAAIWLDENCPTRTSFSDRFPRIIEEFIICQTEVTKITGATISNPKYASELSTLVKKWAGGNPDKSAPASWCSQGIRLGERGNIFVHVQATIEDAMFGKLSPIGQEVLNQLNYAAFSPTVCRR